jgi:hypothetical protein
VDSNTRRASTKLGSSKALADKAGPSTKDNSRVKNVFLDLKASLNRQSLLISKFQFSVPTEDILYID